MSASYASLNKLKNPTNDCRAYRISVIVGLALLLVPFNPLAYGATVPKHGETVLILVDRSASIAALPVPDTVESLIVHTVQVAQLSRRPVKFAVLVYNGDGVKVFGDALGQPTRSHAALLARLRKELPKPNGDTPMEEALEAGLKILAKIPPNERVTILHISDGVPTGKNPSSYPTTAKFCTSRACSVYDSAPDDEKQDRVDELHRQWSDPQTPEGKRLLQMMSKAALSKCLGLCGSFKAKNVRYISVDFNGIVSLKHIHLSAGGSDKDYLVVKPANRLVQLLHERGVTRYAGVLLSKPYHVKSGSGKQYIRAPLNPLADAALISIVFDEPLERFNESTKAAIKIVPGRVVSFHEEMTNPDTYVAFDSAGRVAMLTLRLQDVSGLSHVSIGCRQKDSSKKSPPFTIYVHQRLSEDTRIVFRPANSQPDTKPPYQVSPNQPVVWQAYIDQEEGKEPLSVASLDATLSNKKSGEPVLLDMVPYPHSTGIYVTRKPIQFPPGKYDVNLSLVLKDGLPVETKLADHVHCQAGDEHLTIELDDSSLSPNFLDAGELGDEVTQKRVTLKLRLAEIDYPVSVELQVVDLIDKAGNLLPPEIIKPKRSEIQLRPGRPTLASLDILIPEHLAEAVEGRVEGRLVAIRTDLNSPIEIRAYKNSDAIGDPPDTVRFYLRRPSLTLAARRAWRNELVKKGKTFVWPVHVDFGKPFTRTLQLKVGTDSSVERSAVVRMLLPFRNAEGRSLSELALTEIESGNSSKEVSKSTTASWTYRLAIPDDLPSDPFTARVRISAPGIQPAEIELQVIPRRTLLAPQARWLLGLFAGVGLMLAIVSRLKLRAIHALREGAEIQVAPGSRWQFLSVEQGQNDSLQIRFEGHDLQCQLGDGPMLEAENLYLVDKQELKEAPLLVLEGTHEDEAGLSLLIHDIDSSGSLLVRVIDAGKYTALRHRHTHRFVTRSAIGLVAALAAILIYSPSVLSILQWCWDAFRLF